MRASQFQGGKVQDGAQEDPKACPPPQHHGACYISWRHSREEGQPFLLKGNVSVSPPHRLRDLERSWEVAVCWAFEDIGRWGGRRGEGGGQEGGRGKGDRGKEEEERREGGRERAREGSRQVLPCSSLEKKFAEYLIRLEVISLALIELCFL